MKLSRMVLGWTVLVVGAMAFGAGEARANYSPLMLGNEWVYKGAGNISPTDGWKAARALFPNFVGYREELQLKVVGISMRGDTIVYTVRERDSLYARDLRKRYGIVLTLHVEDLPDTVAVRNLVYEEVRGRIRLVHGDSLYFGHGDTTDIFFSKHDRVAMNPNEVLRLTSPYQGLQVAIPNFDPSFGAFTGLNDQGWYLNGIGLYWAKLNNFCSQCGCDGNRELLLSTYNRRSVDLGIDPPGLTPGLAKVGQIACRLNPGYRKSSVLAAMGSNGYVNILGRAAAVGTATPKSR